MSTTGCVCTFLCTLNVFFAETQTGSFDEGSKRVMLCAETYFTSFLRDRKN